ncbi:MAG TPA: hypothetical protein VMI75_21590 [Polyangiaceae bacterium]|nr:hypothetical protein [Polyangiaceae bacterium]
MTPEVIDAFDDFTDRFEGRVGYMYTDIYGLVTTGRGNLIDPGARESLVGASPSMALGLGWHRSTGDATIATDEEVVEAYWAVKRAWPATQSTRCESLTSVRLYLSDINRLTAAKRTQLWTQLLGRFPDVDAWPSPAQLGLLSMAWAMGAYFAFPRFEEAARAADWARCAAECPIRDGSAARNAANVELFLGAARGAPLSDVLPR